MKDIKDDIMDVLQHAIFDIKMRKFRNRNLECQNTEWNIFSGLLFLSVSITGSINYHKSLFLWNH